MKILITGVVGFVGFHVAQKLISDGFDIVGIDNVNNYYDQNINCLVTNNIINIVQYF